MYTTWKVDGIDGSTPMYWFIISPYKSPPFGALLPHLLSRWYMSSQHPMSTMIFSFDLKNEYPQSSEYMGVSKNFGIPKMDGL